MKAFVIKDVGFYAKGITSWVQELEFAKIFDKKEDAQKFLDKLTSYEKACVNPEIVTLTICEGDLEKALEIVAEKIEFMAQMLGQTLDYDIKENLIQQAKESEKDDI